MDFINFKLNLHTYMQGKGYNILGLSEVNTILFIVTSTCFLFYEHGLFIFDLNHKKVWF